MTSPSPQRFRTAVMDPPWWMTGGGKRGAHEHYPVLKTPAIFELVSRPESPLRNMDPNGSHLWMWVTNNYLPDGLWLMKKLGFRYITNMAWGKVGKTGKPRIGIGHYLRGGHEICLLGTMGRAMVPSAEPLRAAAPSLLLAERGRHSAKPEEAYDVFESVSPGPYLEMFARSKRPGWTSWGNEV